MIKSNELRIPFAEWLYRMSEADVPYQARALAVYAVAFKITANEELARLSGMDTKGLADKTYNKWKSYLSSHGWVIIKQVTIGRIRTIEIAPALNETAVTFTDLVQRLPRRFYAPEDVESTVAVTVASTIGKVEITAEPVEVTVAPPSPTHARAVDNNINITNTYLDREEVKERGFGGKPSESLQLEAKSEESEEFAPPPSALEAFNLYNDMALRVGIPQARSLTPQRRKSIGARMREHGGLEAWKLALANIEKSAFLQGRNDRGWTADLEFVLQAKSFTKLVEGTYGNGAHAKSNAAQPTNDALANRRERIRKHAEETEAKIRAEKQWSGRQ